MLLPSVFNAYEDQQPAVSLSSWTFNQENGDMVRRLEVRHGQFVGIGSATYRLGELFIINGSDGEIRCFLSESGFDANLA